jgi:hypothetical protein
MSSDIRVIHARQFVKATVQGEFDLGGSKQALLQIAGATPSGLDLMVDVRAAPAYLTLVEVTDLASEFMKLQIGKNQKTAVLTDPDRLENARFFSISARNMGASVQAFTSFEEAFDWLAT